MSFDKSRGSVRVCAAVALIVSAMFFIAFAGRSQSGAPAVTILSPTRQAPVQTNLVSDIPGFAITTDPNLINPWGISNSPTSPYWISDQGTGKSTLYNGAGVPTALIVTVPPVGIPSGPTGTVFNGTPGFLVNGTAANFIFVTLDGTVAARATGNVAVTEATIPGALFTGLTLANNGSANFLYAANFASGGGIMVFDSSFHSTTLAGSFTDPALPAGYSPYNIQLLGGKLYVTYAQIGARGAAVGPGLGFVSVFDTNGNFLQRLISNGRLNAPWGLALAPAGFMTFANDLLVGNFGDGRINAYDPATGVFVGTITDSDGRAITNVGLWALQFGNGNAGSTPNTLFFTAGINGEQDGLFGAITPGPLTVTFPGQLIGTTSAAQTVTVENTGSAPLNLTAAPSVTGTNGAEFAVATTGTTCTNGATVPQGGSCVINLTFAPGAAGARGPAVLTIADNAASSPQTLSLSGTGTAGSPAVTLSPAVPLTFGSQLVSSSSAAQTVTVTNSGSAPLIFGPSAISVSNDFTQTNSCNSATVAVNGTCTIAITFAPSSTVNNPRTGTLSIASNAGGSPQTLALSGTGSDFGISVPASVTTTAGGAASIPVTITGSGGFTGTVTVTCTGTIPQGSCVAPGAAVTAPGSTTVTVSTSALAPPVAPWRNPPASMPRPILLLVPLAMLAGLFLARRARTRLSFAGALLFCVIFAGCGSSSTTTNRTPAGSYPFTVTGTSGGVSHSTTVNVTVN